jgi:hypothetical protein
MIDNEYFTFRIQLENVIYRFIEVMFRVYMDIFMKSLAYIFHLFLCHLPLTYRHLPLRLSY